MILAANDLTEWVSYRRDQLIDTWSIEIDNTLSVGLPAGVAMADEFHNTMLRIMLGRGTEVDFVKAVANSNTGIKPAVEKPLAERFFNVTLKLARAASRSIRHNHNHAILPYIRAIVLQDGRQFAGSEALSGVILPRNHVFWKTWLPPLHPDDIRTHWELMTDRQFSRHGGKVTPDDDLRSIENELTAKWPDHFLPLLDFRQTLN